MPQSGAPVPTVAPRRELFQVSLSSRGQGTPHTRSEQGVSTPGTSQTAGSGAHWEVQGKSIWRLYKVSYGMLRGGKNAGKQRDKGIKSAVDL